MAYDPTNRGSFWPTRGYKGLANIAGAEFYAYIVGTNARQPKSPSHLLFLSHKETQTLCATALFPSEKCVVSGSIAWDGVEFWVNIYKNDHADKDTSPQFNMVFKPKNQEAQTAARDPADDPDDIPF